MKKLLAILLALVMVLSLCACGGEKPEPTQKTETYPKLMGKLHEGPGWVINELYVWNERAEQKVYTYEILPDTFKKDSGEKLPAVIFVHGNKGNADSLVSEPKYLAKHGYAGFTMECRGASAVKPLSGEGSASTTSRATDLDAVFEYVKSLDWVDQSQIYIYGQSHGGMVVMHAAPYYQDEIAGMIIESSGMTDSQGFRDTEFPEFAPKDDNWKSYMKSYNGKILMLHAEGDTTIRPEVAEATCAMYNERETGTCELVMTPNGDHAFNSFSDEGQATCYEAMLKFLVK